MNGYFVSTSIAINGGFPLEILVYQRYTDAHVKSDLLERAGWTLLRISGSHHIFAKPGEPDRITVPVHGGKVRDVYVKKIKKRTGQ